MFEIGFIAIMIAAFCAAIHYKSNEYLMDYDVLNRVFWQFSIGILAVLLVFRNVELGSITSISPIGWFYILTLAVICGIGAYGFMILSVNKVGATITGALDYLEPVIGVGLAIVFFAETMTWQQLIGWILIMGTLIGIRKIKK